MAFDHVELSVPARKEYARTIRMTAAALASRMGMSIDEVDDVRIAVEEAYLFGSAHLPEDQPVRFSFELSEDLMKVTVGPMGCTPEELGDDETASRYAQFILQSVCDDFELVSDDGDCFVRFTKRKV